MSRSFLAHVLFSACVFFSFYSFKTYYLLEKSALPIVAALTPSHLEKTNAIIEAELLPDGDDTVARELLNIRADDVKFMHQAWTSQTIAARDFALIQSVFWALMSAVSLVLTVVLHKPAAAP